MSTDNQHSTSPASDTKTDTVSWLARPLKYITELRVTVGDYYMNEIKPSLESHIYVLAILSTRDTDLSAYVADFKSAYNAYDEALKAEQNIKLLLLRRAPANLTIVRVAQTYASTASTAKGIVKTLTQKYGMRANVLLKSDLKDTFNLAETQHTESLNLLYTSDLEKLGNGWTTAERDRLNHLILMTVLYHGVAAFGYGNEGYEANRRAAQYFNRTRIMLRLMMDLFPEKEGRIKGSGEGATFAPEDKISSLSRNAYDLVASIPVKDNDKQGDENKIEPSINLPSKSTSARAELQLPPARWLERLLDRRDRRSGEDVWLEASRIRLIHKNASQIRVTDGEEYLASYNVVSSLIDEAAKYRQVGSEALFKQAARRALSEAKVLNKKYGAAANRVIEIYVAKQIRVGDTIFRNAWEHLTSDILARRYEAWSDRTQDEVLEKFNESEAHIYPHLAAEALKLLEVHCDQCHAGPTASLHYAEARTGEDSNVQPSITVLSCQTRIRENLLRNIISCAPPFDNLNKASPMTVTNDHYIARPSYVTSSKDVRFVHGLLELEMPLLQFSC
ncbi:uncharacterized protein STEHIDRAFT_167327 [Stereum hirsutum FP-91666 SS1]|uniref:uncharacterized protein n=1 Tax=Stereum hirsutum (strain FP-91666) TaxID=721885 RepID=UPI000440CFD8|nr:uncharacterized protein STEHIDRAFT_167327 [Stereum hirsutum FP-91666 SS1]EIM87929.1 hypothetical protein STEHIDRAFT_167327 [Stereum hirsutum FP-91666 SS1]